MNQLPSVGIDRTALFAVLEQMLGDLAREKMRGSAPPKTTFWHT